MYDEAVGVQGHLLLEVADARGRVVRSRRGVNLVVAGGRQMLARLLAGEAREPEFRIGVGLGDVETTADMKALAKEGDLKPVPVKKPKATENAVALQGSFAPAPSDMVVAEAGLLLACKVGTATQQVLYNRVRVLPVLALKAGETLTATWELSFSPVSGGKEG